MDVHTTTILVGGRELKLEVGRFAERSSMAVTAQYGETVVFAAVVMGRLNESLGYFPLSVEYEEKLFAGGKIKGSRWVKRDGRPSDDAILKARLIDRSIRPLFTDGFKNEVQVIVKILSVDGENDADIPAMYAVSLALTASEIPWAGPISAVRVGIDSDNGEFLINPTFVQRETSTLDLVISGSSEATIMLEAGAKEVDEATMLKAFSLATEENARISQELAAFAKKFAKAKVEFAGSNVSEEILKAVAAVLDKKLSEIVTAEATLKPHDAESMTQDLLVEHEDWKQSEIKEAIFTLIKKKAREMTLTSKVRPDGRALDEIRLLSSEVGILPRTHGSAMFKRGSTQALTIVTLGSPALNQLIENMEGEYNKRYIHHYSMPPYTVGETGRTGWPSRREIGHGALAERALEPMIPSEESFPYTIHVVSELMSSNGSTSMASVCGSTLALMDAGVPITKPVAGIAMGLMTDGKDYVVLSDIMGFEDHTGDMDFKVAGTADGITAMQMDIKVKGIPPHILEQALEQARIGRMKILDHMLSTLAHFRPQLSAYAPKIESISIPVDRIGEVIGAGGKIIKGIITESGAEVDINDDGMVFISSTDAEAIQKAKAMVEGILKEVEPGEEYDGKVVKLMDFGAFVEILPGKTGMVHVSKLTTGYVKNPEEVVKVGDEVHVWVSEVDKMGRINLTMVDPATVVEQPRNDRDRRHSDGGRRQFDSRPRKRY